MEALHITLSALVLLYVISVAISETITYRRVQKELIVSYEELIRARLDHCRYMKTISISKYLRDDELIQRIHQATQEAPYDGVPYRQVRAFTNLVHDKLIDIMSAQCTCAAHRRVEMDSDLTSGFNITERKIT